MWSLRHIWVNQNSLGKPTLLMATRGPFFGFLSFFNILNMQQQKIQECLLLCH